MYSLENLGDFFKYTDCIEGIDLKIKKENFLDFINPQEPSRIENDECIQKAFDSPLGCEPIRVKAKNKKRVVIIVSDSTRGIPTSKILPFVIKELELAGINLDQIKIIVALGVHRDATKKELKEIVGSKYFGKVEIINHNGFDKTQLVKVGITSQGTPLLINKLVAESDFKIIIGKVEPHEFAGFSGGRKSILPGISGEETIEINHRPEMLLDPNSCPGVVISNKINLDMDEAAKMVSVDFNVSLILNSNSKIVNIFCGDLFLTQKKSIEYLNKNYGINIKEKADIIITTPGEPFNIDFYQTIKSIIGATPYVKDDGVIFIYSKCVEGVNSPDMLNAFGSANEINGVISFLLENYKIQMDHTLLLSKILLKGTKIVLYSPNVTEEESSKMFLNNANSIKEGLDCSLKLCREDNPKILIFPQPHRYLLNKENDLDLQS